MFIISIIQVVLADKIANIAGLITKKPLNSSTARNQCRPLSLWIHEQISIFINELIHTAPGLKHWIEIRFLEFFTDIFVGRPISLFNNLKVSCAFNFELFVVMAILENDWSPGIIKAKLSYHLRKHYQRILFVFH